MAGGTAAVVAGAGGTAAAAAAAAAISRLRVMIKSKMKTAILPYCFDPTRLRLEYPHS